MTELVALGAPEEEIIAVPLDEIREWEKRFRDARRRRREAAEEEEDAKEVLREYLGDAEFGSVGGKITLRYRSMNVRRFNTKRFRKAYPELAEEFTEENEERRMEVIDDDE